MTEFDNPTEQPAFEPAPVEGQVADPVQPQPDVEMVEFKNRDWEASVPRNLVDEFASKLNGMDADRLRQAIQIGLDGTRLYENLNDERDRLRQAYGELERARSSMQAPAPTPVYQQPQAPRFPTRPPSEDVIGSVGWLAERFENIAPQLDRLTKIEEMLANTSNTINESRQERDRAEERSSAMQAYSEVRETWSKKGLDMPPQRDLERKLHQIPLSDNVNATWHEIWNDVAWMVAGPTLIQQQKRKAVIESQNPHARITVPASSGSTQPTSMIRGPMSNGDDNSSLDAEADNMARQLSGLTAGQTVFPQR